MKTVVAEPAADLRSDRAGARPWTRPAVFHPWARGEPFAGIALALVGASLLVVGPTHEPWFDEAQAWLLARDADPWTIVSRLARYEGTPAVWHLILWVVQRLGLPYGDFWVVSASLAFMGATLVLFAAPLPALVRVGFVFSYFFLYQYAIVARSYALDLVLVPGAAALHGSRLDRPLIFGCVLALLANANAFSTVLAGVLAADAIWSARGRPASPELRRRQLAGLCLVGVAVVSAMAQAWPVLPADAQVCCGLAPDILRPIILFTEGVSDPGLFAFAGAAAANIAAVLLCVAILAGLTPLWRASGRGWLALGLLGAMASLMALVGHFVHAGFVPLILLFLLWISWEAVGRLGPTSRRAVCVALAAMLVVGDIDAAAAAVRDVREPYSASRAAAPLIAAAHILYPERRIAAVGLKAFALQPYLPRNVFADAAAGRGYWVWRRGFAAPTGASPAELERLKASRRYDLLVVSDGSGPSAALHGGGGLSGYCVIRGFPGALIWKTRRLQLDGLVILGRCGKDWSALLRRARS